MHAFDSYNSPLNSKLLIVPKVLVSARFLYTPQKSHVLRELVLTHDDELPDLPRLFSFVDFWKREIDGKLRRVEWMWGSPQKNHFRHPVTDQKF